MEEQKIEISVDEFLRLKVNDEKLKNILKLIFENTKTYYEDELMIINDTELMNFLKVVESQKYKDAQQKSLIKK